MYLSAKSPEVREIISKCFPDYTGNKCDIRISEGTHHLNSYWSGGSRTYFVFFNLITNQTFQIPDSHPYFNKCGNLEMKMLPPSILLVEHCIFCGKDVGITIFVHPDNMPKFLPVNNVEISEDEKLVLKLTRGLKSSYAGISDYRFHEAKRKGINRERWDNALKSCIEKGLLAKNKAITNKGRNLIERI